MAGNSSRNLDSKSGRSAMARSTGAQDTIASSAVCRDQRLGPRKARIRETSISVSFDLGLLLCSTDRKHLGFGEVGLQIGLEGFDADGDQIRRDVQRPGRGSGWQNAWAQRVRRRALAVATDQPIQTCQPGFRGSACKYDVTGSNKHGTPAACAVRSDGWNVGIIRIENDFAVAQCGKF